MHTTFFKKEQFEVPQLIFTKIWLTEDLNSSRWDRFVDTCWQTQKPSVFVWNAGEASNLCCAQRQGWTPNTISIFSFFFFSLASTSQTGNRKKEAYCKSGSAVFCAEVFQFAVDDTFIFPSWSLMTQFFFCLSQNKWCYQKIRTTIHGSQIQKHKS